MKHSIRINTHVEAIIVKLALMEYLKTVPYEYHDGTNSNEHKVSIRRMIEEADTIQNQWEAYWRATEPYSNESNGGLSYSRHVEGN